MTGRDWRQEKTPAEAGVSAGLADRVDAPGHSADISLTDTTTRRTPPNPHATPAPRVDVAALAAYNAGVVRAVLANRDRERLEKRREASW